MRLAIIGSTGMVGRKMLQVLEERNFVIDSLILAASDKSVGNKIIFQSKPFEVVSMQEAFAQKPHIALFSAGSTVSQAWAKRFVEQGTFVIDNSSAWRLHNDVPLIVPEVNIDALQPNKPLIANPNCSTIQLVVALAPLHRAFKIKRVVISTYQSVTGSGVHGSNQLRCERANLPTIPFYPHQIDLNLIPQGGSFNSDGYTTEEQKLIDEVRKILSDTSLQITATVVRVPVYGGHSESVNIEFYTKFELDEVKRLLKMMPGIVIQDEPEKSIYPMPFYAQEKDDVFVGRIRKDFSIENGLNIWVVSDNLRKGAATNAVQIAEYIVRKGWIKG
ncbi:MAG TPA: aspartate-semialdehyde dehydrogenase [Bacteroidales bacterium]|nr:aspartate-semialdehyde dehydrogenase [Bacteroidales bacterium]HQO07081.1 aspartate-semialdehyde dehydrogenase [Bacteroidales bacterium]HQP53390.1 aspartate-semialdehyde dehydrogenase [Bacteroidales bacterium]